MGDEDQWLETEFGRMFGPKGISNSRVNKFCVDSSFDNPPAYIKSPQTYPNIESLKLTYVIIAI